MNEVVPAYSCFVCLEASSDISFAYSISDISFAFWLTVQVHLLHNYIVNHLSLYAIVKIILYNKIIPDFNLVKSNSVY